MIPESITLEGFTSYKTRQTLRFDDAKLWMLTGENGAGKSSIFDAITYALFGEHRLSGGQLKNRDTYLIHNGCSEMFVEFVFSSGGKRYRVTRKEKRVGNGAMQWDEETATNEWKALENSRQVKGFNDHCKRIIGLNYDAFTCSVLLLQGKSDAIINASAAARADLLSRIVQLEPYEALETEAKREESVANADLKSNNAQLAKLLDAPTKEAFEAWGKEYQQANTDWTTADEQIRHLVGLKVKSEDWERLCHDITALEGKVKNGHALTKDAEVVRTRAARHDHLRSGLFLLNALQKTRAAREAAQTRHVQAVSVQKDAEQKARAALNQPVGETTCGAALITLLQNATSSARCAERRYHPLKTFSSQRTAALQNDAEAERLYQTLLPAPFAFAVYAKTELEQQEQATRQKETAQAERAAAKADYDTQSEALKRFADAGDAGVCLYCGQVLSPEKRAAQQAEMETCKEAAKATLDAATTREADANAQARAAATRVENVRKEHANLETDYISHNGEIITAQTNAAAARERANVALNALPRDDPEREALMERAQCALNDKSGFPTDADLAALESEAARCKELESEEKTVKKHQEVADKAALEANAQTRLEQQAYHALPSEDWRMVSNAEPTAAALQEKIDALNTEQEALADATDQLTALKDTETNLARWQDECATKSQDRDTIPEGAKRPAAEIVKETQSATTARTASNTRREQAKDKIAKGEALAAQRKELDAQVHAAQKAKSHWERLSKLFGSKQLQAYLLKQTEDRIIERANHALKRFSNGRLTLFRSPDSSEVLDLVCFNDATLSDTDRRLHCRLLSGSQKFRVSVALALALGETAAQGEGIPSVIIDEGFGSLDTGNQTALGELSAHLKRVIVVSHQEAFADKFPNRWHIRLDDQKGSIVERRCA